MKPKYKDQFLECLLAIEYTLSIHGDEDWLRAWVEGDEEASKKLKEWKKNGCPTNYV